MPLQELRCDLRSEKDVEVLRSITTLQSINGEPAAQFWNKQKQKK